jgi:hypothetical protein
MRALIILAVLATPALAKMRQADPGLTPIQVATAMRSSAPVDTCIVAAIKKIAFPKSSGRTTINYPFNSSPE